VVFYYVNVSAWKALSSLTASVAIEKNSNSSSVSFGFLFSGYSLPFLFLEGVEFRLDIVSLQFDVLSGALVKRCLSIVLTLVAKAHATGDI